MKQRFRQITNLGNSKKKRLVLRVLAANILLLIVGTVVLPAQIAFASGGPLQGSGSGSVGPSGGGNPTYVAAAINACKPYADEAGVSSDNQIKNNSGCTVGWTAGKQDKPEAAACTFSGDQQKACQSGYAAGKNDKPVAAASQNNTSTGNGGADKPSCEGQKDGFSLSWVLCPIIEGMAKAVDGIYNNLLQPLLATKPIDISGSKNDPTHTFAIWSNFRIYGDIFLVIALLVVVFGEAIGGGLIEAYAVKKILPRLLIAAVFINISIYLVAFAVDVTNILGQGLGNLIEQPFKAAGAFKIHISGAAGDLGVLGLVGGTIFAGAVAPALAEFLLVFVLIPVFFTFIAGLILVLVRRALIILLVLSAPIAIALYCLPNTEKYFRKWLELLTQTLLVYPIIAVIFALANVLSITIGKTTDGILGTFSEFLGFIGLVAPLFLIPFSFKLAGGLLGRLHDLTTTARKSAHAGIKGNPNDPNSWGRSAKSKLSAARGNRNLTGLGAATALNPRTSFSRQGWQQKSSRLSARREGARQRFGNQYLEGNDVYNANKGNDKFLFAHSDREKAVKQLQKAQTKAKLPGASLSDKTAVTAWTQAIGAADTVNRSPATRMQTHQDMMKTGFNVPYGQEGYNQVAKTVGDIVGATVEYDRNDNAIGASGPNAGAYTTAMNNSQYNLGSATRFDQRGINDGTGWDHVEGTSKASLYELANAKVPSVLAMGEGLTHSGGAKDANDKLLPSIGVLGEKHAILYKELEAMKPSAKGGVSDSVNEQMAILEAAGVQAYMNTSTGGGVKPAKRNYDPASPTAATWNNEDRTRGWRIERVDETYGDVAGAKARSYERPNPDNL